MFVIDVKEFVYSSNIETKKIVKYVKILFSHMCIVLRKW